MRGTVRHAGAIALAVALGAVGVGVAAASPGLAPTDGTAPATARTSPAPAPRPGVEVTPSRPSLPSTPGPRGRLAVPEQESDGMPRARMEEPGAVTMPQDTPSSPPPVAIPDARTGSDPNDWCGAGLPGAGLRCALAPRRPGHGERVGPR